MADTAWLGSLMPNGVYTIFLRVFDDSDKKILNIDFLLEYFVFEKAVMQVTL
jgi:hypothetical protein